MITCPSCGQDNPDGFRLCGMCGASLAPDALAREERKVVTVVFCDLVGFTAKAELARVTGFALIAGGTAVLA